MLVSIRLGRDLLPVPEELLWNLKFEFPLVTFLFPFAAIAMSNISDVREVLTYYSQFEDPIAAFRENQRRLMETMAEQEKAPAAPPLTGSWLRSFTRR